MIKQAGQMAKIGQHTHRKLWRLISCWGQKGGSRISAAK